MVVRPDAAEPEASEPAADRPRSSEQRPQRIALVGVGGSGKTLLFHRLSGLAGSAGYELATAEVREAEVKLGGRQCLLLDTPGIAGLDYCSEHEAPTRELLMRDSGPRAADGAAGRPNPPQTIVQCVDATNLARSLVLTAQLADLELPLVVCLNMGERAAARGAVVDPDALAAELGVPVVAVCAPDGGGVRRLVEALPQARRPRQVGYPRSLQSRLDALTPAGSRAHRVDRLLQASSGGLQPGQSVWHMALEAHNHWARGIAERVTRATDRPPRPTLWDRLGDLALHPVGSWAFLLLTIAVVYLAVAKIGVALLANGLEQHAVAPLLARIARWTGPGWLQDALTGPFGLLSLGFFNAVCTVLPILLVFYLIYGFLEEVGYFPLLSARLHRVLRSVGLSGRAVLPITLGFGCNSVATMATRSLESPRQRLIACFLIALGVPCAVQLGVIVAILSNVPLGALAGFIALITLLQVALGRVAALVLPRDERGEFLVEIPPLRAPRWRSIVGRTRYRLRDFFLEACPLFVASAALLQLLQHTGLLGRIRDALAPIVVRGLGLPVEFTDMLLMTLARREVGAVMMKNLVDKGGLDLKQVMVGLTVMTLFVPCLNSTLVLGRVVGWRRAVLIFVVVMSVAIAVGAAVNLLWR